MNFTSYVDSLLNNVYNNNIFMLYDIVKYITDNYIDKEEVIEYINKKISEHTEHSFQNEYLKGMVYVMSEMYTKACEQLNYAYECGSMPALFDRSLLCIDNTDIELDKLLLNFNECINKNLYVAHYGRLIVLAKQGKNFDEVHAYSEIIPTYCNEPSMQIITANYFVKMIDIYRIGKPNKILYTIAKKYYYAAANSGCFYAYKKIAELIIEKSMIAISGMADLVEVTNLLEMHAIKCNDVSSLLCAGNLLVTKLKFYHKDYKNYKKYFKMADECFTIAANKFDSPLAMMSIGKLYDNINFERPFQYSFKNILHAIKHYYNAYMEDYDYYSLLDYDILDDNPKLYIRNILSYKKVMDNIVKYEEHLKCKIKKTKNNTLIVYKDIIYLRKLIVHYKYSPNGIGFLLSKIHFDVHVAKKQKN